MSVFDIYSNYGTFTLNRSSSCLLIFNSNVVCTMAQCMKYEILIAEPFLSVLYAQQLDLSW